VLTELGIAIDKPSKNQLKPENPTPKTIEDNEKR
jgi:hypothetical protein